jgi:hypothetical protein
MRTNPTACCPGNLSVPWLPGVASLVVGLMTMSCASFGPNKLRSSHLNYNKAVQQAQMEEDLLNIVRLRYLDTPVSLSVSSISAQASFTVGSGGEFGLVEGESSANILPEIGYTDRPTITFTPFAGKEFLDSLARPIPLEVLVNLTVSQAGYDVLLRVAVANLNGIRNRFDGASPEFNRLAARFHALEAQDDLGAGFLDRSVTLSEPIPADSVNADSVLEAARDSRRFEPDHDGRYRLVGTRSVPFLWIDPGTTAAQELLDQLRLTKDATSFEMKSANQIGPPARASDFLAVRPRSLLVAALYLSHGVDVPEAHERAGIARPEATAGPDLSDLFRVRVSETKPREPGIAVEYRDHWFFIPDADHASKRTFGLLQALFLSQLTKGTAQGAPILTLPLN